MGSEMCIRDRLTILECNEICFIVIFDIEEQSLNVGKCAFDAYGSQKNKLTCIVNCSFIADAEPYGCLLSLRSATAFSKG